MIRIYSAMCASLIKRHLFTEHSSHRRRRNAVGRSASCYQTVSSSQLPVPTNPMTADDSSIIQEFSEMNIQSNPNAVAAGIADSGTPTDDVYQVRI